MALTDSTNEMKKLSIAPDFKLKNTDNKFYSLDDLKGEKLTLIVFMCNHCPYVIPKLNELNRIAEDYREKGLVLIGINPNDDEGYPEDSFKKMQEKTEQGKIRFPYLRDESQEVARSYGAVCTPDPFLFNDKLELIYHGRIDDVHGNKPVNKHELYEYIEEYLENGRISENEGNSIGCSIKWK